MPISTAVFVRSTLAMLVVGMIALLGIVGTSLWLVTSVQGYFETLVQVRAVRSASADLLSTLQDAETGQRGFIVTREEAFLQPYEMAMASLAERRRDLADRANTFPEYAARLPDLDRLVQAKVAEMSQTIDLVKAGAIEEAVREVKSDRGRELMDGVRAIIGDIIADADRRLESGVADTVGSARALQWTTVIGAIAIVAVLGGAIVIVLQHVRELVAARREVESLNAGLERRVEERTEELIRANQEIQRFAYIVTHDLRAPLVNIMGFTSELQECLTSIQAYVLADEKSPKPEEILEARRAASEDLPEAIGFIRSSTKKMDSLINAILKISRDGRRELKIERVDIKSIVETAAAAVHHQITETDGTIDIAKDLPAVISDRLSIEQIFGNLFDNAVKYQYPGRPPKITVRSRSLGRQGYEIAFEDNGRGVAPEDHERIFELFRRSGQQDRPGEGIGLAHVRTLIRNLGGDISVRSELGKGTTFVLRLPHDLGRVVRSLKP